MLGAIGARNTDSEPLASAAELDHPLAALAIGRIGVDVGAALLPPDLADRLVSGVSRPGGIDDRLADLEADLAKLRRKVDSQARLIKALREDGPDRVTAVEARPRFYEGQFLSAADLTATVDYTRTQRARMLLGGHRWGIALGLDLMEVPGPNATLDVVVQPGYAWDGFGRPIIVAEPAKLSTALFTSFDATFSPDRSGPVADPGGDLDPVRRAARPGAPTRL